MTSPSLCLDEKRELLKRGYSRRRFGRIAALVSAGATLPFFNEGALAQFSKASGGIPPDAVKQRYSTRPNASSGKVRGVHKGIPSATDFTSDGEFLKQTALDNAFLIAVEKWTKEHRVSGDVRRTASKMLAEDQRLGDEIRKLAGRKHVTLSDSRNEEDAATLSEMDGLH